MDGAFSIIDIAVTGVGIYIFYAWYLLKYKGQIQEKLLLSAEYPYQRCKDKEGYRKYMEPRILICAVCIILIGVLSVINDFVNYLGKFYLILVAVILIVLIWFSMEIKKCYKKFW